MILKEWFKIKEVTVRILIKNGRIINPKTNLDLISDLLVEDGLVKKIKISIDEEVDEMIDAKGKIVVPGFVDLHVHLREPGFEGKETIESGTHAAVAGGVTTVACMPNTKPAIHSKEVVAFIKEKAKQAGYAKVEVVGAITTDIMGREIAPIGDLMEAGVIAISDDGRTTPDTSIMLEAFNIIKKFDLPLMAHTEDEALARGGAMHLGVFSERHAIKGIPSEAESNIVKRDIEFCKESRSRLHICHVSTKESIKHIRQAKEKGVNVTVEICPHHFILSDEDVDPKNAYSKVNPPLRSKEDVKEMLVAIQDGTIDCIVTDHAPHEDATKKVEYSKAAFGISGLETSFPLSYTHLVKTGLISLNRLIDLMSLAPSKIIKKDLGDISEKRVADISIIDIENQYTIDSSQFISKGKNTPFNGYKVYGNITHTLVNGRIVYRR
jgi:dihydroorotase